MNRAIIIRNLFLLKNHYLKYLSIILLMPMIFYLISVIAFSSFFNHDIKLWSSVGIWFACSIIVSYLYIYDIFSIFRSDNFFIKSPISIFKALICISFFALLVGFVEFIISYSFICFFNGSSISLIHFLSAFFSILPINLIFISIAMIFSFYDKQNIALFIIAILCVSFIQFSQVLINLVDKNIYVPIFSSIKNVGDYIFVPGSEFNLLLIFVTYVVSFLFLVSAFYVSINKIRKTYER